MLPVSASLAELILTDASYALLSKGLIGRSISRARHIAHTRVTHSQAT